MGTKDVNIGGTGLVNINFASISTQVIFIDTMKCFLNSLGQIARTLDEVEKAQVEKLILQFLNRHSYFLQTWRILNELQKRQVLNIIVSAKGVIPYEKINSIDSLSLKPENGVFIFEIRVLQYVKRKRCK